MEAMTSVWSYQENVDQLKELLLYATFELETARNEAREETRRNEENVNQLVQLLKITCQERDEARDQLQKLMNKFTTPTSPSEAFPLLQNLIQPAATLSMNPTKGNSTITETDSISETHNHHSHGSSPVDSFFNAVSSPEFSNVNFDDSTNDVMHQADQSNAEIENLVKGKPLPQKGNLLQAVMEAGPLLQTLLLAGPLPHWRNPPPLQPLQLHQKPDFISASICSIQNSQSLSYNDVSHGSMLNFSSGQMLSTGVKRDCTLSLLPTGKKLDSNEAMRVLWFV